MRSEINRRLQVRAAASSHDHARARAHTHQQALSHTVSLVFFSSAGWEASASAPQPGDITCSRTFYQRFRKKQNLHRASFCHPKIAVPKFPIALSPFRGDRRRPLHDSLASRTTSLRFPQQRRLISRRSNTIRRSTTFGFIEYVSLHLLWSQSFMEWLAGDCVGFYLGCWGSARLVLYRALAVPRGSHVSIKNQGSRISPCWCRSLTWKTSRICKWNVIVKINREKRLHRWQRNERVRVFVRVCAWVYIDSSFSFLRTISLYIMSSALSMS